MINEISMKQRDNWVSVDINPETPKLVTIDSERVIQILQNLLLRAI